MEKLSNTVAMYKRIVRGAVKTSFRSLKHDIRKNGRPTQENFLNLRDICPDRETWEKSVWCKTISREKTISEKLLKYAEEKYNGFQSGLEADYY